MLTPSDDSAAQGRETLLEVGGAYLPAQMKGHWNAHQFVLDLRDAGSARIEIHQRSM